MAGDPYWNQVVLAMHMDGANASTAFTDVKGKVITSLGNAQISTAQSKFGGSSAFFDGTGDYLNTPSHEDFNFGSGDFTIEFFIRKTTSAAQVVCAKRSSIAFGPFQLYCTTAPVIQVSTNGGASWNKETSGPTFTIGEFVHIAAERYGTSLKIYTAGVGGTSVDVGTDALFANSNQVSIGATSDGAFPFSGYLDDLRITKGLARYKGNFTPPAAEFPNSVAVISGTVRDAAGTLCARTVRAYRRSDGALVGSVLSNAATGEFSIPVQLDGDHTVIALDDDAGTTYNALVFDKIAPV